VPIARAGQESSRIVLLLVETHAVEELLKPVIRAKLVERWLNVKKIHIGIAFLICSV